MDPMKPAHAAADALFGRQPNPKPVDYDDEPVNPADLSEALDDALMAQLGDAFQRQADAAARSAVDEMRFDDMLDRETVLRYAPALVRALMVHGWTRPPF